MSSSQQPRTTACNHQAKNFFVAMHLALDSSVPFVLLNDEAFIATLDVA